MPMKQQSKISQREQPLAAHTQQRQQGGQEFASAEELLRFDASQTPVPPANRRAAQAIGPACRAAFLVERDRSVAPMTFSNGD